MNQDTKNKPSKKKPAATATPPANQTTQMSLIIDDNEFPTLGAASSIPKSKTVSAKKPNQEPPLPNLMQSAPYPHTNPKVPKSQPMNQVIPINYPAQPTATNQNNSQGQAQQQLSQRETQINAELCRIILSIHNSGKYVSRERVQKDLFQHFQVESWYELRSRPSKYNALMNLTDNQKGLTFYMQVFEHIFNLCTLHDLEPYIIRFLKVKSYDELLLGPIDQNPEIQRVFQYKPTQGQSIPSITIRDVIKHFIEFQNSYKRNEQFPFEDFLDELVKKYDLQSRADLAIFCKSFPYLKQVIGTVRRDMHAIMNKINDDARNEIAEEVRDRLKDLKNELTEGQQLEKIKNKTPTALFVHLMSTVEKYMDVIPERATIYAILAQLRENELLRCLFNLCIYLSKLDEPEDYVQELKKLYKERADNAPASTVFDQIPAPFQKLSKKDQKKLNSMLASQQPSLKIESNEQTTVSSTPVSTSFASTLLSSQPDLSKPPVPFKQLCLYIYDILTRYDSILTIEQLFEIENDLCNEYSVPNFSVFNYHENGDDDTPINFVSFVHKHRHVIDPHNELSIYDHTVTANDQSDLYSFVNQLAAVYEDTKIEEHEESSVSNVYGNINVDPISLNKEKLSAVERAVKHKFGGLATARKGKQLVKKAKQRIRKRKSVAIHFEETLLDLNGLNRLDTCPTTLNINEDQLCQLILHCPLMIDLATWLQWSSFFQPKYSPLKSFIDKNVSRLEDLRLLETSNQELFRLPSHTSLATFEDELQNLQIRSAVGHLCALIVQEGLVTHFPFNAYRTTMVTWFHQLHSLKLSQNDLNDPLQYVLEFLMYLPGIIGQSRIVNELVLRPLSDVFGNDEIDGLNPRMRIWNLANMKEKTKLELWGHMVDVNEWKNESKWAGLGETREKSTFRIQNNNTTETITTVEPVTPKIESHSVSTPDVTPVTPILTSMPSVDGSELIQSPFEHIRKIRRKFGIDSGLDTNSQEIVNHYEGMLQRSLKELSTDLYSNQIHFVLELIQNADDNQYKTSRLPTLRFMLSSERILVSNNEKGFQPENIDAICDVGNSTKGKHKQGYAGHKGIGFKSVFMVSDRPEVHSRDYHIQFDVSDKENRIGYIRPNWIDKCEEDLPNVDQWTTSIRLPLKKDIKTDKLKQNFEAIQARLLLFLNRLRQIEVIDDQTRVFTRIDHAGGQIIQLQEKIGNQSVIDNFWLVVTKVVEVPEKIKEELHDVKGKLVSTTMSIAYPLSGIQQDAIQLPPTQPLFAYLPLRNFGFRFILQGDFEIPANRQDIRRDNPWNEWLKSQMTSLLSIAYKQFRSLPDLLSSPSISTQIQTNLTSFQSIKYFLKLLPSQNELDPYFRSFVDESLKLLTGIIKLPVLRENEQQQMIIDWISPSQCVIVKDSYIRKILSSKLLLTHFNCYYIHEELADECDEHILLKLGCRSLDFNDITQLIEASYNQNEQQHTKTASSIAQIAEWLLCLDYSLRKSREEAHHSEREKEIIAKLKQLKIIPLKQQTQFVSIDQFDKYSIAFPLDKKGKYSQHLRLVLDDRPTVDEQLFNYIEDKYPDQLEAIKRLLKKLGMSESLNIREIYRQHILPVMSDPARWSTKSESVLKAYLLCVFTDIYSLFRDTFDNELDNLRKYMIIKTQDNRFVSLGLSDVIVHLSSRYSPKLSLETLNLSKSKLTFISNDYYRQFCETISPADSDVRRFISFLKELQIDDFLQIKPIKIPFADVSQLVNTKWSYLIRPLTEKIYEPFYILDSSCEEFNKLVEPSADNQTVDTELCVQLLKYLDINHSEVCANYSATVVLARLHNYGQGTPVNTAMSSFAISLQEHAWIPVVGGQLFKPADVYFMQKNNPLAVFRKYVPHLDVSKVVLFNEDFAYNILGLKREVTPRTMFDLLMKWSCGLEKESLDNLIQQNQNTDLISCTLPPTYRQTCLDTIENFSLIYDFLASHDETRSLLYAFRTWPLVFIPQDEQTGEFIYAQKTFWSDPLSLLSSANSKDHIPIEPYYNKRSNLQQFFVETLQIQAQPTIDDYLPLLSTTEDDEDRLWKAIEIITQLAIEQNKQIEVQNKCVDIAFIPCLGDKVKFVKYTDHPFYPHHFDIANLFANKISIIKLPDFKLRPQFEKDFRLLFNIESLEKMIRTEVTVTNEQPATELANFYRESIDLIQDFLINHNLISQNRSERLANVFSRMRFISVTSIRLSYSYENIIKDAPKSMNTDTYIDEQTCKFYILKKFETSELRYTEVMANFLGENDINRSDISKYIKHLLQTYQNDETEGLNDLRKGVTQNHEPKWTIFDETKIKISMDSRAEEDSDETSETTAEVSNEQLQIVMNSRLRREKLPPKTVKPDESAPLLHFPSTAGISEQIASTPKDENDSKKNTKTDESAPLLRAPSAAGVSEQIVSKFPENDSKKKHPHKDYSDQPPVPMTTFTELESPSIATFEQISISTLANADLFSSINTTTEPIPSASQHRPYGNETDLITGRLGEHLVFRYLTQIHPNATVQWMNKDGETGRPYDILVSNDNQKEFIEVKTTRTANQHTFQLSIGEMEYLLEHTSNYFIYRVYYAEPKEQSTITVIRKIKDNLQAKHLRLSMTVLSQSNE